MARFIVKDVYDYDETLVETDDLNVAYKAALTRAEDTDGECSIEIIDTETVEFVGCNHFRIELWGDEDF